MTSITLYSCCWNERRFLPYFLRHYEQYCKRIVIYDNGSDDGSQDIITEHPLCELRHADTGGKLYEELLFHIKNEMWKEVRETSDWVICCDIDELLYHPDLSRFLSDCKAQGITIPAPAGWQMVSQQFPTTDGQVYDEVKNGFFDEFFSKRVIFSPSTILAINYTPGGHSATPEGNVRERIDPLLKLLHFKYLGRDYLIARYAELAARLSDANRARGFGHEYLRSPEQLALAFSTYMAQSEPVPLSRLDVCQSRS